MIKVLDVCAEALMIALGLWLTAGLFYAEKLMYAAIALGLTAYVVGSITLYYYKKVKNGSHQRN